MGNFAYVLKNDNAYKLGSAIGFLAGMILFASILFFITRKLKIIPQSVEYLEVVLAIVLLYLAWLAIKKIKK